MQSKATTVKQYLAELPPDRRAVIQAIRKVFLDNLGEGIEEGMQYGAIGYYVPHRVFPAGYHCDPRQPLPFAGLGSQKNHMSLGLMSLYGDAKQEAWFRSAWAKTGKKLDMGKCCVRFKKVDDVALDVLAEAIRRSPAKAYIAHYEAAIKGARRKSTKPAAAKPASKAAAKTAPKAAAKAASKAAAKTAPKAKSAARPAAKASARKKAR